MHDLAQDKVSRIKRHTDFADKQGITDIYVPSRSGKDKKKYHLIKVKGVWEHDIW